MHETPPLINSGVPITEEENVLIEPNHLNQGEVSCHGMWWAKLQICKNDILEARGSYSFIYASYSHEAL